ncbi:MAG: GNAT family acetyltransferase [Proteobacteria bacterium]|nr:MAG: GNAT family acetyltransferase [Pseudomonadota bacterium]
MNESRNAAATIRPFRPADTEAVVRLWRDCRLTRPWNDPYKDIERKLAVQPELFLVAVRGARVVGTVMGGYDGHRGWINYLAVSPSARRRGEAGRLVDTLERALHDMGCPKVNLQIRRSNRAVIEFYESIGYREDDVLSMGKRLIPDAPPQAGPKDASG